MKFSKEEESNIVDFYEKNRMLLEGGSCNADAQRRRKRKRTRSVVYLKAKRISICPGILRLVAFAVLREENSFVSHRTPSLWNRYRQ